MKYRVHIRRFLNHKRYYAGAYVIARVQDTSALGEDEYAYAEAFLTISDCNRVVDLLFDVSNTGARRNSLRKIEILASTIEEFKAALELEAALARDRKQAPSNPFEEPGS